MALTLFLYKPSILRQRVSPATSKPTMPHRFRVQSLLLISILCFTASARTISSLEAQQIANEFFGEPKSSTAPLKIKGLNPAQQEAQPFYIFNSHTPDNGFVIISGDDRAQRILGYSDSGSFDADNIPPQLADLLKQYAEQISSISSDATHPSWNTPASNNTKSGVLLKTADYGQDYPYNLATPKFDGEHAPTGCVATAMAIVMKYHNWPEKGRGFYNPETDYYIYVDDYSRPGGCAPIESFNFEDFEFNWEQMDSDENVCSQTMNALGRAMGTRYFPQESGAQIYPIGAKLHHYFHYSPECQVLLRDKWDAAEWSSIIKDQLDRGYPIIYFTTGAHAFVCDGYSENEYFHFNFGWDGMNNGYYLLNENIPTMWNVLDSGMVINIIPYKENDETELFTDPGYIWEGTLPQNRLGQLYVIKNDENPTDNRTSEFHLYTPEHFKGYVALAQTDADGNVLRILSKLSIDTQEEPLFRKKYKFSDFSLDGITEDDYFMLVYRSSQGGINWKRVSGTLEAKTFIRNDGYMPRINLKWEIDPLIKVRVDSLYSELPLNTLLDENNLPISVLKGNSILFEAETPEGRQAYVYISSTKPNEAGYHNAMIYENPNILSFSVDCWEDKEIEIHLISPEEQSLTIDYYSTDDTYFDSWSIEDFEPIKHLKVNGNIGFWGHLYVSNRAFGLRSLDYSDAEYVSEDFITGSTLYLQYLNELQYPKNTRKIWGCDTWNIFQLTTFVIPETVQEIEDHLWDGEKPRTIVCKAITPPQLIGDVFNDREYPGNDVSTSTLLIPKGCKEGLKTNFRCMKSRGSVKFAS